MANTTDKSILTAAGKALLAQLNAEEKPLIIDKMIFANVPNRPEFPQPDDVVPNDSIVHQEGVEQRGRLSADSVIYSTTLTSDVGPFEFNWTGAYCSEYGVLVTVDHHALTPKTADEPGVAGNTLVRSVVLEYKDIAEITNITVDASTWQYNATERLKKMDTDVAQAIIDQNGKDWFIEDGFLVTPQGIAFNIKAGAGYVSGNRVTLDFDRNVQVPNKPSFICVDAYREGTPNGEQVTLFDFVVTAEEKDDYTDSNNVKHFVCKIAQVLADGSVSDLRPENALKSYFDQSVINNTLPFNVFRTVNEKLQDVVSVKDFGAVGDGVVDDWAAIQSALNTRKPIFLPGGKWRVTKPLTFYAGQTIEGVSNPEKSLYVPNNTTQIIVDGETDGLEHRSVGVANGARFKDFTLKTSAQHAAGSGTQGLEIGKWGGGMPNQSQDDPDYDSEGWKYQAIRLTIDNVMIQGFDINASFWGWCWEMTFHRFYTFKDSTTGARFGRGVTGVNTMIQCSFLGSNPDTVAGNLGGTSLLLDGAAITCFNCRWEGANGTGIKVRNGSKFEAYTPYFESNEDFDVQVGGTKCDVKILGGESDYGLSHTACLAVKEDEENAAHNIVFRDFKHNAFDPIKMKPRYCSWFITNPYANVRLENIDDNTDVPFLDYRLPPDYMTFSKFPGVTLRSNRSNVSEKKVPWDQGGAKVDVDGSSLPASLIVGYAGFDLIQQVNSGTAHIDHRRYSLYNHKWIISAPLSYRNVGIRNMSQLPATLKIENYAGLKIFRYSGQGADGELTLDLTNAMVGMDFEIIIEKTELLPNQITIKNHEGNLIDTVSPGENGFYGRWVMADFQGSGVVFRRMMAMPY